ncbi:hypothetical protein J3F83DRAFT_544018 [Trichoderma novae-zelandiae]
MKLGSQRVHACQTCRRRKIKCDNKLPNCTQCTRLRKKCPGSTEGLIFIHSVNVSHQHRHLVRHHRDDHMKATSSTTSPTKHTRVWNNITQQTQTPQFPPDIGGGAHGVISRLAVEIGAHHLSPWTPHPWFLSVPQLALSSDTQSRMLLPLQAMAVAFRALAGHDAKLSAEAFRYYSSGLELHRAQLHQLTPWRKHQRLASILNLLLMSMALLEFEMMAPLATDSWFPHAYGALGLLEQVGPEGCQESPFFEVFWQLRFFMSYVALSTRKTTFLGSQSWMEIPFRRRGKTEFDCVIDTILLDDIQLKTGAMSEIKPKEWRTSDEKLGHGSRERRSSCQSQVADHERMIRVLTNVRDLVSAGMVDADLRSHESLSMAVLSDSKHLMKQPLLSFNVGLQVTAAASLVARHASDAVQKQEAALLYADWRGRFALTC